MRVGDGSANAHAQHLSPAPAPLPQNNDVQTYTHTTIQFWRDYCSDAPGWSVADRVTCEFVRDIFLNPRHRLQLGAELSQVFARIYQEPTGGGRFCAPSPGMDFEKLPVQSDAERHAVEEFRRKLYDMVDGVEDTPDIVSEFKGKFFSST